MTVLLVEDNEIDARMVLRASETSSLANSIHVASDGARALAYLRQQPPFTDAPRPHLGFLDLNLPGIDGRDVLAEMKADESLRQIPVIIMSSSTLAEASYGNDAAALVTKPVGLEGFSRVIDALDKFWCELVTYCNPAVS
ncbi:MAG: response regulator [Actinomycetia bacterium]|nr:response regulator [Actinomycetes bacterium]